MQAEDMATNIRRISILPIVLTVVALAVGVLSVPRSTDAAESSRARLETILDIKRLAGSGFSWIMAEGYDPRLSTRPGWDTLTRAKWDELGYAFSGQGPVLQQAGGGAALVPFREAAPAFSRNILVTRDFSQSPYQTEPHVAVNPNDPDHLIVGVIDYGSPSIGTYVSFDGGQTWDGPRQVPYLRDDLAAAGDPVVAFDRDGNVHAISISVGVEEFSVGPFVFEAQVSSISIGSSNDGGLSWGQPVSTATAGVETDLALDQLGRTRGEVRVAFLDKPWMAVGPHPANRGEDMIYVTYTDFTIVTEILYIGDLPTFGLTEVLTTIMLVRSEDGGRTWTDPIKVSPTVRRASSDVPEAGAGVTEGLKRIVQGSYPVVANDGTVYVTWMDTTDDDSQEGKAEIYLARSEDGGETFEKPIRASVFQEPGFRPKTAFFRYWGSAFPRAAVGPGDEVYIVYTGLSTTKPTDDGDNYFVRSLDRGQTWSVPQTLGGDETDRLQFFPAIATDPNGVIHVMWGDMRDDPAGLRYHIYYTKSDDRGQTWGFEHPETNIREPDTRITDFGSNSNRGFPFGLFIGDYFGMAATEDEVYSVWADTRLGEFGLPNQKIAFARSKAITSSEVFLSPGAGPGGQEVTIQGFNFQPNLNVFIQVGGVLVATDRTNSEGRFTNRLFMPVSGEGAQEVLVFDESGNVAPASFFTEFGFGNVRDVQQSLESTIDDLSGRLDSLDRLADVDLSVVQTRVEQAAALLEEQAQRDDDGGSNSLAIAALAVGGIGLLAAAVALFITTLQLRRREPV